MLADTSLSGLAAAQSSAVPSSQRSSSAGYLWGSSSVWQPWTPVESPGTPTRRPPGFGNENPKLNEVRISKYSNILFMLFDFWIPCKIISRFHVA